MAQSINTNLMSLNAQRHLSSTQGAMATAMERLSSGLRVNSARDDAAGLAIAERMHAQVRGMKVAIRNSNDGISMAQVAEGGLNEVGNMLQRMRELAVQSANGTNSTSDRANLNAEFTLLDTEIGRFTSSMRFNGLAILGADAGTFTFQIGPNPSETMDINTVAVAATGLNIATLADANTAITGIDTAIDSMTTDRAMYGASQSRFESAIASLEIAVENQEAARGRIIDADFAVETSNLTRAQILQQAGTAMVSQANQAPQQVLSLLGG
ncbi:flagellin [Chromatiales bacterium (ex Bugula neritina AB1)]|nr:flagellin [Chromatiales bacterium (ex Bugula neritina AB1)]